jgi:hypothetical protein
MNKESSPVFGDLVNNEWKARFHWNTFERLIRHKPMDRRGNTC